MTPCGLDCSLALSRGWPSNDSASSSSRKRRASSGKGKPPINSKKGKAKAKASSSSTGDGNPWEWDDEMKLNKTWDQGLGRCVYWDEEYQAEKYLDGIEWQWVNNPTQEQSLQLTHTLPPKARKRSRHSASRSVSCHGTPPSPFDAAWINVISCSSTAAS